MAAKLSCGCQSTHNRPLVGLDTRLSKDFTDTDASFHHRNRARRDVADTRAMDPVAVARL
ncbi:hypothetical protein GCM10029964_061900 [Kibdelosporangium lantanae]